jgi:peptidoglycan/LPS O-acetylase OafA/YrhL
VPTQNPTAATATTDDRALPRQLDILQVYRGIAATLVVLYHLTWWGGSPVFMKLPFWTPGLPTGKPAGLFLFGHSGVDFFFTLSGFVMVWGYGSDAGNPRRLWSFLVGRFTRIYPTYWVVFALTICFYLTHPGINDHVLERPDELVRGFWLYGNGPWHVPPAGTLPFELALYVFFALSFLLGPWLFTLAALAWCSAIIAQWGRWHVFGSYPTLLNPQMLEFFLGALAAVVVRRFRPRWSGRWLALALAGYLVLAVADSVNVATGFHQSVLTFAIPYALFLVLGCAFELRQPRHYPRLLMLLGDASFSIYLTHFYLIWQINGKLYQYPIVAQTIGYDGQRTIVLALVLSIGVAFWALVERPLLRLLHRGRRRAKNPPLGAITAPELAA